jgi:hypothetical protein
MKLRYKILIGFVAILALVTTALVIVLSYETECPPPMSAAAGADTMKAVIYRCYGSSEVIEFVDLPKPEPADNEILVKIEAAAVNPLDWHYMRGSPYIMRLMSGLGAPDDTRLGVDFAGTVETVGAGVTRFEPGDGCPRTGPSPVSRPTSVSRRRRRFPSRPSRHCRPCAIPGNSKPVRRC